jgi:hypothetical protein
LVIVFHLRKIASFQQFRDLILRQCQGVFRGFLELFFLMVVDFCPLAFSEPVHKPCLGSAAKKDDGSVAFRSSLPWPGDPLFDDPTSKVGVNLALFGPYNSLTQGRIRNPFLAKRSNHLDLKILTNAPESIL